MNSKCFNKIKQPTTNEDGYVLIASLLVLLILVVIGIAATNTTTFELQIAGNEKVLEQTFYVAESGWQRGFQVVENSGDKALDYLNPFDLADNTVDIITDQPLHGTIAYSYTMSRGQPTKVPGSGKNYHKFTYNIDASARGMQSASKQIRVIVTKITK